METTTRLFVRSLSFFKLPLHVSADVSWIRAGASAREARKLGGAVVRVHQRLGRTRDAVDLLLEMHREVPGNAEACCALAKLEPSRARHWYEKAFKGQSF